MHKFERDKRVQTIHFIWTGWEGSNNFIFIWTKWGSSNLFISIEQNERVWLKRKETHMADKNLTEIKKRHR